MLKDHSLEKAAMYRFENSPDESQLRKELLQPDDVVKFLNEKRNEILAKLASAPSLDLQSREQSVESQLFHSGRYETTLELQLYRAITQLRVLQETRRGFLRND